MYIFKIIQWLDGKVTDKNAVLEMMLFNNLSKNLSSTDNIKIVEIFYINIILIK